LNSGPTPWATPPALFSDIIYLFIYLFIYFEIRSHKLSAWADFKPWASWSLPPE
jgi:hypothetical protein